MSATWPIRSLALLACFEQEAKDQLRCEAAVRYFRHVPDRATVRVVSTQLAFYRGASHEANP